MRKYVPCLPIILAALCILPLATRADTSNEARQKEYSLNQGHLAIQGYDPVSYHLPTGPVKGEKRITAEYRGVVYRFANQANKAAFLKNPAKYEPEYGGWCAWAMLDGDRTEPHPDSYKIVNGKLYLFYDGFFGDTLKAWNEKTAQTPEPSLIKEADRQWALQLD